MRPGTLAALAVLMLGGILTSHALAAPSDPGVDTGNASDRDSKFGEKRCVSAGTRGSLKGTVVYDEHPESPDPETTWGWPSGVVRLLPRACKQDYTWKAYATIQVKTNHHGDRWLSLADDWQLMGESSHSRPIEGTKYTSVVGQLNNGGLRPSCVMQARTLMRLDMVDARSGRIVARRIIPEKAQVDSWRRARCMGHISLWEKGRECGGRAPIGASGRSPYMSNIRARNVSCGTAMKVAQRAIEGWNPDTTLRLRRVGNWRCSYAGNSIGACWKNHRKVSYGIGRRIGWRCASGLEDRDFTVAGTSCNRARVLEQRLNWQRKGRHHVARIGGDVWRCYLNRTLLKKFQHCYAGRTVIAYERLQPWSTSDVPSEIPSGTTYPPSDGPEHIPRPVDLKFGDYEEKAGRVLLEISADAAVVGQRASLHVKKISMACREYRGDDPLQTFPECRDTGQAGKPIRRDRDRS